MLKRNVYILFPAGFSGSYLRWAISRSDRDLAPSTPEDPLSQGISKQYGGAGTAHSYARVPTHQMLSHHLGWVIANRPTDKRVYLINVDGHSTQTKGSPETAASMLLQCDPDGVIINIHDGNDPNIASYADINSVLKWPTYLHLELIRRYNDTIDAFNCNTTEFRNFAVDAPTLLHRGRPMNFQELERLVRFDSIWYRERSKLQPHEINDQTYPHLEKLKTVVPKEKVFELTCKDIASAVLPEFLDQLLASADLSTDFDTTPVKGYHQNYVAAQTNLQWFDSLARWEKTGELDDYLLGHAIIQAQIIKRILLLNADPFYGWRSLNLQDINNIFQNDKHSR